MREKHSNAKRIKNNKTKQNKTKNKKTTTEDHWSCIAHLSAEDMLKSAVIKEMKFKYSP